MPRLHNSMALQQLSLGGILLSQTFPNSIYCRRHDPIPLKTISNFISVESMLHQRMMDGDVCTCIMYRCCLTLSSQPLDLAQLVEHTTVTVKRSLYGRWFDSGSREMETFFSRKIILSVGRYPTHSTWHGSLG